MKTISNVQITAKSGELANGTNGYIVEVNGMDNKLNCKRHFQDPLKAMRYMFLLSKKLDLKINTLDLAAVSVAYQKAKEAMEAVVKDAKVAVADTECDSPEKPIKIEADTTTPIIKQWQDLKKKHPDALLLFRCGDFYETYFEDARDAANILGITLTKRSKSGEEMAGFQYHALDTYLPKLIRAGKRVSICDQISGNSVSAS